VRRGTHGLAGGKKGKVIRLRFASLCSVEIRERRRERHPISLV
jgi:hypothetical protein